MVHRLGVLGPPGFHRSPRQRWSARAWRCHPVARGRHPVALVGRGGETLGEDEAFHRTAFAGPGRTSMPIPMSFLLRGRRLMRGDFADLLDETLLFAANPGPRAVPAMFPVIPLAGGRPDVAKAESPTDRKIWQFEIDGLDAVRDVTVRVRSMRDMRMSVCREVKWGGGQSHLPGIWCRSQTRVSGNCR
jgi:hypothetical protein